LLQIVLLNETLDIDGFCDPPQPKPHHGPGQTGKANGNGTEICDKAGKKLGIHSKPCIVIGGVAAVAILIGVQVSIRLLDLY
jgi:hypothetical protein